MKIYDVWLQCVFGAGNRKAVKAITHFGNSENLFKASLEQKKNSQIFTTKDLDKLQKVNLDAAQKVLDNCKKCNVTPLSISSPNYPQILKETENPPIVIYYRGNFPDFDNTPAVAIVGPRKVSEFGGKSAYALARRLSSGGFTVVSGGAHGADTKAHKGALSVNGVTVCVLPCGHNFDYLPEQRQMREEIEKNGCTISEKPPFSPLDRAAFHVRNRIISALCQGVIVVEAPKRSGSLITANFAMEQGRDVFVIPGNPTEKQYAGSNLLLKDGAAPLLSAMDIFGEYSPRFPDKINSEAAYSKNSEKEEKNTEKNVVSSLSKTAILVYNNMNAQVFSLDDVYVQGLTLNEMISALTELEILGLIKTLPGGRYSKK